METFINNWLAKTVNLDGMKTVKLTNNLFDLFWGLGWKNQARFKWVSQEKEFILLPSKDQKHLPKDCLTILNMTKELK